MSNDSSEGSKPYVRLATPEDFEAIIEVAHKAFLHDPVFMYFGSVTAITETGLEEQKSNELRNFVAFLLHGSVQGGGRITVVAVPPQEEGGKEKIACSAYWMPPNKRIELYKVGLLLRSGVIGVLKGWGLNGLLRVGFEYLDKSHTYLVQAYKEKGLKKSPDDSWYLQLMMTDPEYQGRGFMSMLVREAFAHAPDANFVLEATTPKSKDQYAHLGYTLEGAFKLGTGKVAATGLPATGEAAVGVDCFTMVKWPSPP